MQTTRLLLLYATIIVAGELVVVALGLTVWDRHVPALSVPISIFLYFAVFALGWKLALRLTAPKQPAY